MTMSRCKPVQKALLYSLSAPPTTIGIDKKGAKNPQTTTTATYAITRDACLLKNTY